MCNWIKGKTGGCRKKKSMAKRTRQELLRINIMDFKSNQYFNMALQKKALSLIIPPVNFIFLSLRCSKLPLKVALMISLLNPETGQLPPSWI